MVDFALAAAAMLGSLFGAALGLLAGLVPGLHANNVAQAGAAGRLALVAGLGALAGAAGQGPEGMFAACGFLVGVALGHAFTDEIPAVFLGAPDPDTALSVLPGHRLLHAGLGASAVRAAAVGSALGVAFSLPLVPLLAAVMGPPLNFYAASAPVIPWLLLAVAGALCLSEPGRPAEGVSRGTARLVAVGALLLSGAIGELVVFERLPIPNAYPLGSSQAAASGQMLALFAGLFGLPTLLLAALHDAVEPVAPSAAGSVALGRRRLVSSAALGTGAGAIVGWLPGVGSAQAAVLATFARERARRGRGRARPERDTPENAAEFLVMQSAVAAANLVFNLVALFSLLRVRSGTMSAVAQVGQAGVQQWSDPLRPPDLIVALLLGVTAALPLCLAGALFLGRICAAVYRRLPPRKLSASVFCLLLLLILALGGVVGLGVALAALCLGLVPPLAGVKRVHLMGAILIPVALRMAAGAG
jgi:putative membrane protein